MEGFIKLYRQFQKWEWYNKSEMVHLFVHFLLLANHKENKWQGQTIKSGQFVTGLYSLNKDTGISVQTIRTCIDRLKSTGEITYKSTNKFRIITITNWAIYQQKQQAKQQANQQTTNNQLTTNKNVKNDKNTSKAYKMFYQGQPVIKDYNKLYVLQRGDKILFTGKESDIEYVG